MRIEGGGPTTYHRSFPSWRHHLSFVYNLSTPESETNTSCDKECMFQLANNKHLSPISIVYAPHPEELMNKWNSIETLLPPKPLSMEQHLITSSIFTAVVTHTQCIFNPLDTTNPQS